MINGKIKSWGVCGALVLLLACSIGCSKQPTESKTVKPLVPLKIGNSWSYRYVHWSDTSNSNWVWYEYGQWTDTIVGTQVIEGEQCFVFNGVSPYGSGHSIIRDRGDGILTAEYVDQRIRDDLYFKYPAGPAESYKYTTLDTKEELSIATTRQTITVGAGSFESYVYRYTDRWGVWSYAFSPGVGMVWSTLYNNQGAGAEVVEGDTVSLTSYDLK
jgi:hypothetical protein